MHNWLTTDGRIHTYTVQRMESYSFAQATNKLKEDPPHHAELGIYLDNEATILLSIFIIS